MGGWLPVRPRHYRAHLLQVMARRIEALQFRSRETRYQRNRLALELREEAMRQLEEEPAMVGALRA